MDDEKRIQEIAYDLWIAEGYPEGQHDRHWRMATEMAKEEAERAERESDRPADKKKSNKSS